MSSMDFTRFSNAPETCTGFSDGIYVDVDASVVIIHIRGNSSNGIMAIYTLCSFSFINLSISASISLICAFCSMISFIISSLWPSVSVTSLACEYSIAGSFSYFLRYAISTFFFFNNSSPALTFVRSYPIFNTNSFNDFILLSLAKEEIFSKFN
jgi:hypothetical protein